MKKLITVLVVVVVIAGIATLIQYFRSESKKNSLNTQGEIILSNNYFPFQGTYKGTMSGGRTAKRYWCKNTDGTLGHHYQSEPCSHGD